MNLSRTIKKGVFCKLARAGDCSTGGMGMLYSHIVFQPPDPPTYEETDKLRTNFDQDEEGCSSSSLSSTTGTKNFEIEIEVPLIYMETEKGNTILGAFFHKYRAEYTILFSHGNGEDLGCITNYAVHLSELLHCNVFIYDYSGYGHSEGKPSESNCYADIRAAYRYLLTEKRILPNRILLFGRSLGTGPTIDLAVELGKSCGGVVLISGLTSCLRVVMGSSHKSFKFDMFQNINKIQNIVVPVFCVHGTLDNVVPFDHGLELCRKAKYPLLPLWVRDAGHNNLEGPRFQEKVFERYNEVIKEFARWNSHNAFSLLRH